ncbi:hypothetical protein [Haliangium sp.]|uniref:hypothetical protein n=1 Tax=Haliangium sp. TaxID=2663208 RepID=UPI003D120F42
MTLFQSSPTARVSASISLVLGCVATAGACTGMDGFMPGALDVTVYGEQFVEQGIPAEAFADGWTLRFDTFLVSLGEISAGGVFDDEPGMRAPEYLVFDLARPSAGAGFFVHSDMVPGGRYDDVEFRVAPTPSARAGNVSADEVGFMVEQGFSVYAAGVATRGQIEKTFAWGFQVPTRYQGCRSLAVVDGGRAATVLTLHADHLFYDDLISAEPDVRFDALAAADDAGDGDGDGEISAAELSAVDISGFERYQVGSFPVTDLWAFLEHQVGTLGHIDGEGHCERSTRE